MQHKQDVASNFSITVA